MSVSDDINGEIDRRKLQKLVDDGEISADDLANAPTVIMIPSCNCRAGLEMLGTSLCCPKCFKPAQETGENNV